MKSLFPRVNAWIRLVWLGSIVAAFAATSPTPSAQAPTTPWRQLFNGKDLTGWSQTGAAEWKVENGVIVGGQAEPGKRGSSLVSTEQFKDFELELDFMLAEQPSAPDGSCDKCTYNSGVYLRTGYQVNFGRREAGEFIGIVVHRVHPKAIRGNVLWLDTGDEKFPNLRKKEGWNHVEISFKGERLQVTLNGTKICDVTDNPADPSEAKWREAGPISFQWPPAGEAGGFAGLVKYRNIRIRELAQPATVRPLRVIAFGAHPDDAELKAAGMAARWASHGHKVKFVALTNGDVGHFESAGGPLARRRKAEVAECARILGIETEVLDIHDGELTPSLENRKMVARLIRQWQADVVLSHRPYDYHPDHRYTGVLADDAAVLVVAPFFTPDTPPTARNPVFLHYGAERGRTMKYAEAFELCQYGRQPAADELKKMFVP